MRSITAIIREAKEGDGGGDRDGDRDGDGDGRDASFFYDG
jgi:hypothetical protein